MTKEMRELQALIISKTAEAQSALDGENKDIEKADKLLGEVETHQKEFDTLARLEAAKKAKASELPATDPTEKADGFKTIAKMLRGQNLTDAEKALITGVNATDGENFLIPEDVKTAINELRKTYVSAKELVTVETTESLTGSVVYEKSAPAGLTNFDDGEAIAEEENPEFAVIKFAIEHYGKIIPISRILQGAEKAGLMGYLDRWFVRNAIISENNDIFGVLKAGYNSGTPKAVAGWKALKKSINVDLDPSCLIGGVIATNQSGFAVLDEEEDNNGRPILQQNPVNPTEKLFQGLPVKVYPDSQLPNIDATHFPIFYGNTKAGATFKEYAALEFAFSEHANFNKNQNTLRVIEGFDTISTDTTAYIYGSFAATAKA